MSMNLRIHIKIKLILFSVLVVVLLFGLLRVVIDVKYLDWKSRTNADLNIISEIVERYKEYYGHYPSSFTELYADPDLKPFRLKLSSGNLYEYRQSGDGFIVSGIKSSGWFVKNAKIEERYTSIEAHARFGRDAPPK
jgi:hypothetical protein